MEASKTLPCDSILDSVRSFIVSNTSAVSVGDTCIVTLPVPTVDGRWSDVFVVRRLKESLLVHDNGRASMEMFLRGTPLGDADHKEFSLLAKRYALHYSKREERFEAICKGQEAQDVIVRVAACSAVACRSLLEKRAADAIDESAVLHVKNILQKWRQKHPGVQLEERVKFDGSAKAHTFDFLLTASHHAAAVSILTPTVSSIDSAERFGFKVQDMRAGNFKLRNVAVRVNRADGAQWSRPAIKVVDHFADLVIPVNLRQRTLPNTEDEGLTKLLTQAA